MKYTDEMKRFIFNHYKGITSKELAVIFNERFGTEVKESQMKGFKGNNRLASGVDCKFTKGQVSHNKGKKGIYYKGCEKGWFKKGNSPHNHKPIGSERIDAKDGYLLIKTKEPRTWKLKHRIIYEKHYGKIPKDHNVIFLDGDITNIDIKNLSLVSKEENLILTRKKLRYRNAECTEVGVTVAKILSRTRNLKK